MQAVVAIDGPMQPNEEYQASSCIDQQLSLVGMGHFRASASVDDLISDSLFYLAHLLSSSKHRDPSLIIIIISSDYTFGIISYPSFL